MTREEAKELLPIIKAYAEGEEIQIKSDTGKWEDIPDPSFNNFASEYRIKPEPKYRPFKDRDECWAEMLKHQPFGWLKRIDDIYDVWYDNIKSITESKVWCDEENSVSFENVIEMYAFADGTPFGIKEGGEE